jgi:hypothetical protein
MNILIPHRHACVLEAGVVWTALRNDGRAAFYNG